MRSLILKSALVLTVLVSWSGVPAAERAAVATGPTFKSIGPLAFSPDGVLFAGDTQSAAIFALDLGKAATGGAAGAKAIPAFDQKVAALLGTDVREITVTDLVVHPKTRNAFASVMRGQGNNAQPALLRIDGAGKIDVVAFDEVQFTQGRPAERAGRQPGDGATRAPSRSPTWRSSTAASTSPACRTRSSRRSCARSSYPFSTVDNGTSVEILPRQPRPVRNALAGLHVRAVQGEGRDQPDRRLPVHAAREVPGQRPQARRQGDGHDDRRARQPQPAARHDRLQEGRQGIPADVEQQPRRDEDPDRRASPPPTASPSRVADKAGVPTRRSRR